MIFKVIIQLNCENESLHIFCSHIMFKLKQLNIFIHNNTERGGAGVIIILHLKLSLQSLSDILFTHIIAKTILKSFVYFYFY